ncbi:geranylgeranyl pyrophosphate synthetase [Ilyonectria destructans]|nr:geranylgeranyl pyrophosphate synthetase [Ilyonectria destructans]
MASGETVEISRLDLQDLSTVPEVSITGVRHLSSYNWIERPTPTIAVPGSPPIWSAPNGPQQLTKDSGLNYIDQNAARHPDSPLEPLFRALFVTHPSFDIRLIDVVTDRNNIRKLLSFINPSLAANEVEPFTINIEVTNKTAIFCRKETSTRQYIGPHEFKGFGHEFEKAYTTSHIKDSTGHHRIISYRFGDINFIVRHETDGYVDVDTRMPFANRKEPELDRLSSTLGSLSLSSSNNLPEVIPARSKLRINEEGQVVPIESTIEIKTRVFNKRLQIHDVAPQLWISQTTKLVRAYHNKGRFQAPEIEDVAYEIKRWEKVNQGDLRKLAVLINKILNVVKGFGGNATVRYDGHKLVVRKVDEENMLPQDLYSRWNDRIDSKQETSTNRDTTAEIAVRRVDRARTEADGKTPENIKGKHGHHKDVPFSDMIGYGLDHGFRQFFRRMPIRLSEYHVLCETLESLAIDITGGRNIHDIMDDMRKGKSDWDPEERRQIEGQKSLARDSAFRLLYIFLQASDIEDSNMAYNATLFVVSHRRMFMYRTRKIVREAFVERYHVSEKQQNSLDKWPIEEPSSAGSQEEDVTTEVEDIAFESDSSW